MAQHDQRRDLWLLRGQIAPRLGQLLWQWAAGGAAAMAGLVTWRASALPFGRLAIIDVANGALTFASISTGACISALVLSLGLPGGDRLRRWARAPGSVAGKSALSDLVFVLVWAALVQVALIAACAAAGILGGDLEVAPKGMSPSHGLGLFAALAVFFYALFELVIVVQTLVQVGVVMIAEESEDADSSGTEDGQD